MIDELHIRELALIHDANLEFSPGFNVLTGETGAGKTMLISSLKLLMGERASSSMQTLEGVTCIEARFSAPQFDEGESVVQRKIAAEGKNRCTIDGELSSVKGLAAHVGSLIELHGQHDHQRLLKQSEQLLLFDSFAGEEVLELRASYTKARAAYKQAAKEREALQEESENLDFNLDRARFTLREIDAVNPQEGEYEALEETLKRQQHAESLVSAAKAGLDALSGDSGANNELAQAIALLRRAGGVDPELDSLAKRLEEQLSLCEDLSYDFSSYLSAFDFNAQEIEQTLNRLGELSGLMRKYGPSMQLVFERKEKAISTLEGSSDIATRLDEAIEKEKQCLNSYNAIGQSLARAREKFVEPFYLELTERVAGLAMKSASFDMQLETLDFDSWREDGPQDSLLLYQPAPNLKASPVSKIASGGELSRIMLALHEMVDFKEGDTSQTLVFDEIDAGIGGATATVVAERLKQLAKNRQIIVITHLPQIAACATKHFLITKHTDELGNAFTDVTSIEGEDREREIARMLSGEVTDLNIKVARELLKSNL